LIENQGGTNNCVPLVQVLVPKGVKNTECFMSEENKTNEAEEVQTYLLKLKTAAAPAAEKE
jgi:hypothetical protein